MIVFSDCLEDVIGIDMGLSNSESRYEFTEERMCLLRKRVKKEEVARKGDGWNRCIEHMRESNGSKESLDVIDLFIWFVTVSIRFISLLPFHSLRFVVPSFSKTHPLLSSFVSPPTVLSISLHLLLLHSFLGLVAGIAAKCGMGC